MTREEEINPVKCLVSWIIFCCLLLASISSAQTPTIYWLTQYGTSSADSAQAVASDATSVYTGGRTRGNLDGQTFGHIDAYLRKYDESGNLIWGRQFGTSTVDEITGISLHPSGIYIAGSSQGELPGQVQAGGGDAFVGKYDADGNEIWMRQYGSARFDIGADIATSNTGVYVVGAVSGALPGQTDGAGSFDAYVRKYDYNGNEVWTRQFFRATPLPGYNITNQWASAVAVGAAGVYVGGYIHGVFNGNTGLGATDAFLRKYDNDGNVIWTRQFGTSGDDRIHHVSTDHTGVYVAGRTDSAFPGQTFYGSQYDIFLRKYDFDGNEIWTRQIGTHSNDALMESGNKALATDASGVYLAGWTGGCSGQRTLEDLMYLSGNMTRQVMKYGPCNSVPQRQSISLRHYR